MHSSHSKKQSGATRVELKYCEHCGGLWVREGGGGVYCEKCQSKVADLPAPKEKSRSAMLPVRERTVVEGYPCDVTMDETPDMEAAGGVA